MKHSCSKLHCQEGDNLILFSYKIVQSKRLRGRAASGRGRSTEADIGQQGGDQSHVEILVIYKLGSMKFTTQDDRS